MRGGRNGVHLRPVLISNVRDVRRLVHINVVVDVGHLHAVDDGGVRDVHVGHVPLADVVRRAIHVTRSQREPRHACGRATSDHSDSPMRAANPSYQRWRIHGPHVRHAHYRSRRRRHPTPHATDNHPASIVERSKTPRLIVNPGPSPRRNPNPVAVAIRSPADDGGAREPHVAVFRHGAPAAVFIEVFVADYIIGNVSRGSGMLFAAVAVVAPLIEVISIALNALNVRIQLIGAAEIAFFARVNRIGGAAAGDFALALADSDNRGVAGFVHTNAVTPGTQNGQRQIRRVHFKRLVIAQPVHANVQRAFGQAQLRHFVGEIQERKTRVIGKPDHRVPEMQFGAGIIIRPKFVARGHRAVDHRRDPIVSTRGIERNVAARVPHARHAAGRIVIIGGRALRGEETNRERDAHQTQKS